MQSHDGEMLFQKVEDEEVGWERMKNWGEGEGDVEEHRRRNSGALMC